MKRLVKNLIILVITAFVLSFPLSGVARAFDVNNPNPVNGQPSVCSGSAASSAYCKETANGGSNKISGSGGLLLTVVDIISLIAGIAAVILIIIGGLRFIISAGDANQVSGARNTVIYALVGIVIIALAQTIVRFVLGRL